MRLVTFTTHAILLLISPVVVLCEWTTSAPDYDATGGAPATNDAIWNELEFSAALGDMWVELDAEMSTPTCTICATMTAR